MSRLARIFSAVRHLRRARPSPRDCGTDRPVSSAELVAASAFLDFGGMPSGDWLHAWEASLERDCRLKSEELSLVMVTPRRTVGNKNIDEGLAREKTTFDPGRAEHAACYLTGDDAFPLSHPGRRTYAFNR
jgi:hypothetical protein